MSKSRRTKMVAAPPMPSNVDPETGRQVMPVTAPRVRPASSTLKTIEKTQAWAEEPARAVAAQLEEPQALAPALKAEPAGVDEVDASVADASPADAAAAAEAVAGEGQAAQPASPAKPAQAAKPANPAEAVQPVQSEQTPVRQMRPNWEAIDHYAQLVQVGPPDLPLGTGPRQVNLRVSDEFMSNLKQAARWVGCSQAALVYASLARTLEEISAQPKDDKQ